MLLKVLLLETSALETSAMVQIWMIKKNSFQQKAKAGKGKKTSKGLEEREKKKAGHQDYMVPTHLFFRMQLRCPSWAEDDEVPAVSC